MGTLRDCLPSPSDPSISHPPKLPGSSSPRWVELLWTEPRCRARVPTVRLWAWAQLPLYLEELDSLRLQGLGRQGGEGGVEPVCGVAQHRVPPEWGVCPEHSTGKQGQSALWREQGTRPPTPALICREDRAFSLDTRVVLRLHPQSMGWAGVHCIYSAHSAARLTGRRLLLCSWGCSRSERARHGYLNVSVCVCVCVCVCALVCRGGPLLAVSGLDRGMCVSLERTSLGAAVEQGMCWEPLGP